MTAAAADPRAQSFAANGFRLSEEQEEVSLARGQEAAQDCAKGL